MAYFTKHYRTKCHLKVSYHRHLCPLYLLLTEPPHSPYSTYFKPPYPLMFQNPCLPFSFHCSTWLPSYCWETLNPAPNYKSYLNNLQPFNQKFPNHCPCVFLQQHQANSVRKSAFSRNEGEKWAARFCKKFHYKPSDAFAYTYNQREFSRYL